MNRVALFAIALVALAAPASAGANLHADVTLPTGESHSVDATADESGNAGAWIDGQPVTAPATPELPVPLPEAPALPATPALPEAPALPATPEVPALPAAPELPTVQPPADPAAPSVPEVPTAPSLPAIPTIPVTPPIIPAPALPL